MTKQIHDCSTLHLKMFCWKCIVDYSSEYFCRILSIYSFLWDLNFENFISFFLLFILCKWDTNYFTEMIVVRGFDGVS